MIGAQSPENGVILSVLSVKSVWQRNEYIDDRQYESIYADCEELVKVLTHRCKKLDE